MTSGSFRINLLVLLHLLAIISLVFPYGFPLYSLILFSFFTYGFLTKKLYIKCNYYTVLLILTMIAYLVGVYNSNSLYGTVINDITNIALIVILLIIFGKYNINEYKTVIHKFLISYSYIVPVLAIISLYKYYLLFNNEHIFYFEIPGRSYPSGTSLMPDYNMFALGMVIGLISLSYVIKRSEKVIFQFMGIFSVLLVSTAIVLSGSRRGIVILLPVLLFLAFSLFKRIYSNSFKKNMIIVSSIFIFTIITFIGFKDQLDISMNNNYQLEKLQTRYATLEDLAVSFSSRSSRLQYGFELINNYNGLEIVIGDGFNYITAFGEKYSISSGEGYPHNPLLSAFLYSGIVGFIVTSLFILIPVIKVALRKEIFNIEYHFIYFIVLMFLMLSTNSVFSTNILWLIIVHHCIIPVQKKEVNDYEGIVNGVK